MLRCGRALVVLSVVVVAVLGAALGSPGTAGAQSSSPVRFTDSAMQIVEGRGQVQVMVERTDLPVSRMLVRYRTQDASAVAASDYVHTTGTLVFDVGVRSTSFAVTVRDDEVIEETEQVLLHLETSGSGTSARLTVLDDDLPPPPAAGDVGASSPPPPPPTTAPAPVRTIVTAAPPASPPPVVVAASAGVRRPVPARTRSRSVAARPAPRRIILQQTPTKPFELRPSAGAGAVGAPTTVDPLVALAAGLLLARVAAVVWFRARILAAG